ncbi:MAG: T9SS type A sorting domain-containing protein [Bacteroidota bacterium]
MRKIVTLFSSVLFFLSSSLFASDIPQGEVFFLENKGQLAEEILFQAEISGQQIRVLEDGISFAKIKEMENEAVGTREETYQEIPGFQGEEHFMYQALVWTTRFRNARLDSEPRGGNSLPGNYHYLKGNDPTQWHIDARRYTDIMFEDVYTGIDVRYYSSDTYQLKYDVILHPGASMEDIEITLAGIKQLSISDNGNLIVETAWGSFEESIPYSYQSVGDKQVSRNVQFTLIDSLTFGFRLAGNYDPNATLIIDPLTLEWGTFFHSGTSDDYLIAVARDSENNFLATGYTKALSFPTTAGIYQEYFAGSLDAYVLKMNPDATEVIFATYLGGTDWELAYGLSMNSLDEPYITGFTRSENYPVSATAWQTTHGGGFIDGFVTRLSADGKSTVFSSYLGGSDRDYIYDMEVDEEGNPFFTGITHSEDFPLSSSPFQSELNGEADAFVVKGSADGTSLIFSTFLGGEKVEIGQDLVLNQAGEVFIGGNTSSHSFPVSSSALQPTLSITEGGTEEDGFLVKLSPDGSALMLGTFLGGTQLDGIFSVALDAGGNILVSGSTFSSDYPTTELAYQQNLAGSGLGNGDVFIAKLSSDVQNVIFSTLLGGEDLEFVKSIRVDENDQILVLGATRSPNFPVYNSLAQHQHMYDIFISLLSENGSELVSGMLLGGEYNDYPRSPGSLYVRDNTITLGLTTHSGDIPMPGDTYQNDKINGNSDAPIIYQLTTDDILAPFEHDISGEWYRDQQAVGITFSSEAIKEGNHLILQKQIEPNKWEDIETSLEQLSPNVYLLWDHSLASIMPQPFTYRVKLVEAQATYFSSLVEVQSQLLEEAYVSVYPNPASGQVQIAYSPHFLGSRLEVYDEQGKRITNWELSGQETLISQSLADLSAGIYSLIIRQSNGQPIINRLVVK